MILSTAGGIIIASNKKAARPLQMTGSIPAVKRIVLTLRQAGVFPVVVLTGAETYEVRHQLSDQNVIFLEEEDFYESDMFTSIVYGIDYLKNKCESIIVTPVNSPLFRSDTVSLLLGTEGDAVVPALDGRPGHPVLLRREAFGDITGYSGGGGLRNALRELGNRCVTMPTDDEGIFSLNLAPEQIALAIEGHNRALIHPTLNIRLGDETVFFDDRLKLLLYLIDEMKNVSRACEGMALSGGKAWSMINDLEEKLGYKVVERRQGGSRGGSTRLTERGRAFLIRYLKYETELYAYAQQRFHEMF